MAEEPNTPVPTPEAPAPTPSPVSEPTAQAAPTADPAAPAPAAAPRQAWWDKRIGELTARNYAAEQEIADREARIRLLEADAAARVQGQQGQPAPQTPGTPRLYTEQEARSLAAQEARTIAFNDTCNKIYAEGKAEFADFDTAVNNFRNLGGLPPTLVEAAIETGQPHKVLHALGKDMDKASEILNLPPVRQAVAIAAFAAKLSAPGDISRAAAPITPVVGGAGGAALDLDNPNLSMEDWVKLRKVQQKAANGDART